MNVTNVIAEAMHHNETRYYKMLKNRLPYLASTVTD